MSGSHDGVAQHSGARPSCPGVRDGASRGRQTISDPFRAHLPASVSRSLNGARAMLSVSEPRHAARALEGLPPGRRRTAGRAMVAVSHLATPGSRRSGRAALLEALGRAATGDPASSRTILDRVAQAPSTSTRTRVEIGLLLLQMRDVDGAQRIIDLLDQAGEGDTVERALLRARTDLARARYAEAVASAQRAVFLAPDRKTPRLLLAQAAAQRDVHDPAWRPSLVPPAATHVPQPGHVLHIVSNALPGRQSGYAIRTQSVGQAQLEVGLQPLIAARRQDDIRRGLKPPARWNVGDVQYGLTASGLERAERPDQTAAMNAHGVAMLVEQHEAAILHPATPWTNLQIALSVRERYGIPVVYEVRGFREETWTVKSPELAVSSAHYEVESALETALMAEADAIVTLSGEMRDRLVERGLPPERIDVITNAVDVERFTPLPRDDGLARRLGLGDGPVIGYVSTFAVFEGIEVLIAATAELRRRGRGVRCLLVGDGPQWDELHEAARRHGLDDRTVIFTGRVAHADVNAYYSLIDAFVVPRLDVSTARLVTPLKPYEAMAMERVVVMSRLDALMGMITEGVTGVSFTPGDPRDLADVLEPLLVDPERRATIGRAAGAWVREHRSWRTNAERYLDLYRRLGAA